MEQDNKLYLHLVEVTSEYLGPAADRFIARQIQYHLHKAPEDLEKKDLYQLVDWLKISMSFLTDDNGLIDNYVRQLKLLSRNERRNNLDVE